MLSKGSDTSEEEEIRGEDVKEMSLVDGRDERSCLFYGLRGKHGDLQQNQMDQGKLCMSYAVTLRHTWPETEQIFQQNFFIFYI